MLRDIKTRARSEKLLRIMQQNGVSPDAATYTMLIKAYAHSVPARADEAERVLERMRAAGVQPSQASYNALIKAYGAESAPRPCDAERILTQMAPQACGLTSMAHGQFPSHRNPMPSPGHRSISLRHFSYRSNIVALDTSKLKCTFQQWKCLAENIFSFYLTL